MSLKNILKFKACHTLLLIVCSIGFNSAFSQLQQPKRFESEQRHRDEDFTIIPLEDEGLVLFRKKFKFTDRKRIWEFIHLDTLLNIKKTFDLEIDSQNDLTGHEYSNGFVHLLFVKNETRGDLEIISIDLNTYQPQRHKILPELNITLTHFITCGANFIFGGSVNQEPAVFIYTPSTTHFKIIPDFLKKRTELIDIKVNNNTTFNSVLISRENPDDVKIIFKTFDSFGKQLLEDIISFGDHNLQTGISSGLTRDDLMILGTWGNDASNQSSGFYAVPVNPFENQAVKFTYLGELQHYLDYLKPKRAERIKLKTQDALKKGADPDYSNYIVPHKILEHPKGFILLAETYIPSKGNYNPRYNPYTYPYPYNPYGTRYGGYYPYPGSGIYNTYDPRYYGDNVTNTNAQEIRTLQSQIILFDAQGQVVSDYSIKLDEIKMPTLNQVSDFYLDSDSIYFLYKKESKIIIKKINLNGEGISESDQKVKMNDAADVIRSESKDGGIRHWYGSSFYLYGYQTVKYSEGKAKDIFYINRVDIH